jgi:hypothetical protein
MNFLKNIFLSLLFVELLILLSILSIKSWEKLNITNHHLKTISSKSINYYADISLDEIIQHEKAVSGLIRTIAENELLHFTTSAQLPFVYRAYQINRYLPIPWIDKNLKVGVDKEIEARAKRLLGRRYVWGAVGPNSFDCSGFTMKVFREVGINLPRVSRNQAKVGRLVKFEELKRGDMVFFDTSRNRVGRVNHVGIYLEDGKFIHASSGKKRVVITSFDKKSFYKERFLWGRRVLKETMNYAFDAITLPEMSNMFDRTDFDQLKSSIVL